MVVADEAVGFVLGAVSASQPLCGDMYPCDCLLWFSGASSAGAMGVLHYMKPSGGVSPACRSLM